MRIAIRVKKLESERISPFWVGGYPPFSAAKCKKQILTKVLQEEFAYIRNKYYFCKTISYFRNGLKT